MARNIRYYSKDDPEVGITPSQLKRLGRARQKEYLLYWFHNYFEDPAMETPYESREGGYQYIWGGPYGARDELDTEFGTLVSEKCIEEVVDELESEGIYDWAPTSNHPDRQDGGMDFERPSDEETVPADLDLVIRWLQGGVKPVYGGEYELARRREILDGLDRLKRELEALTPVHGGMGHNRPPLDEESRFQVDQISNAADTIGKELAKSEPDALEVAKATSRLKSTLEWFAKKGELVAESFAKGFGDTVGKLAATAIVAGVGSYAFPPIGNLITEIVHRVSSWLSHVTLPF